jgi:hypothetical protein
MIVSRCSHVVRHTILIAAAVGCVASLPVSAGAALTLVKSDPRTGLRGSYTNESATIHFRSRRTDTRVAAVVRGADGTVLMSVKGDRLQMPHVSYASIRVTDHGDFSDEEQAAISALRVSPQALALGEMLRAMPPQPGSSDDPWAALHELYKFLTAIGGPGPDGFYNWEESPETASIRKVVMIEGGGDPGGGGGGGSTGGNGSGGGASGSPWDCAGDADQCIGLAGPQCWGTFVFGTRIRKWSCEALRHDINARQRDCNAEGASSTGGCCGSLEAAINALLTQPDIGRAALTSCPLNSNCPSPAGCCSRGSVGPGGCSFQGGACREIQYCDPNSQPGSTRVWPCPNEATAGAKYIITRYKPDFTNGNLLSTDGLLVTLPEPGRIVMGISCIATGYGILRVGDDSALCRVFGKCSVRDLNTITEPLLDNIHGVFPAELPFYHKCYQHGFGWYETANIPAGSWLVFSKSSGPGGPWTFGFVDGHGTADTYAYVGNGGMYQATWAGNSCRLNVDINNNRFFIRQLYRDFFNREPDGATPFGGARDFGGGSWQALIESLAFRSRAEVGFDFMQSAEFVAAHPILHPANRGSSAYNQEFVRQCYRVFLRREPDQIGFANWLVQANAGNYVHVINGFVNSQEYFNRAACGFAPSPCSPPPDGGGDGGGGGGGGDGGGGEILLQ